MLRGPYHPSIPGTLSGYDDPVINEYHFSLDQKKYNFKAPSSVDIGHLFIWAQLCFQEIIYETDYTCQELWAYIEIVFYQDEVID